MTMIISSSMVDLPSPSRVLLCHPKARGWKPSSPDHWWRRKPAAWLVARGAPPDALGWSGGWLTAAQMPCQAFTHEIQNFGGRHSCSASQVESAAVDPEHQPRLTRKAVTVGEFAGCSELDSDRARLATPNLLESDRLDLVPGDRPIYGCIFESAFADDQPDGTSQPLDRRPDFRDAVQEQRDSGHNQDDAGGSLPGSKVVAAHEEAEYAAGGHDNRHEQVTLGTAPIVGDRHGRPQRGMVHLG